MGFLKGFLRKAEEEIADILPGGKTGKSIRAQRKAPVAKTVSRPRDESKSWLSKDFNPVSDGINDIKSAFKYASKDWKSSENQRQVDTQNANRQILKKYTQGQLNKNQVESLVGSKVKNAGLKKKGNLYVNTVKNSTGETLLQNTGAGIMNAAPQRVIGGLAEYGGTALGNDSIRDFGTRLNQPFRDYNALAYENADNKAVAIGGNIAGNLLTLPIAPAGKAGLAYRGVVAGAPTAADTGYAIKQAGGGRVAQTIGGGATGIASGYLNSVGGDKILKPVGAVTSKLVGKTVTTKLAPTAFGRIGAGVLNEGGEEVIEQGVDNAVAKSTYDPDRKLTDNLATSFLLGGAMGGVVRGGVELGNPNTRTQLINESKVKDIANDQGGFVSGRNAKDFKQAEAEARKYKSADEFDNVLQRGVTKPEFAPKPQQYNQLAPKPSKQHPLEALKAEARQATGARSDYSPENLQANRQIRAKNASSITYADKKAIKPDELVTVYRAVPGKAKGGLTEGDWVTPNKEQARLFMKQSWAQDDTGAKIVTKKVKASELRYHADDAKGYVDDELLYVPKSDPLEALKAEARKYKSADEFISSQVSRPKTTDNVWQDILPSGTRPDSVKKIVKSGGNPLYHDTTADGVLGILDSGEIKPSQAPFSSLAGQGKRVSTTRNFDNYSRYNKSPYRLVVDESKAGQRAIPDNREEFESIFRKGVPTKAVNSIAIDTTNPALLADIRSGKLKSVIESAKKKGITIEPFEGKVLPNEGANAEVQTMTSRAFSEAFPEYKTRISQLTDLYNQATQSQPPKSPIGSLKQEADSVRKVKQKWEQKFRQQAEKLSPEEANNLRTKMMKDAQKELSGYRTEDLIDADIKNARQSEIPDSTTSNKVKELLEKPVSKNDYDPNNVGYFLDLSSENIKDVTPLKGIEQYSDGMYVSTKAGTSEVKIQDWSDSGQGFRVSNGNGNEIARFNTNAEAVEFAKKALTIENEAKRQGKRVILSGSRVENRTQSQPPKAPVEGKASNQGVSDRRKPVQDKVNRTEPKRTETAPKPTLQDALDGKSTKIEPKVVKTEPKIPKVAPKRTETAPKKPFIPDEIKAIRAKREANTSQQTRTDQTRKNQQALDSKSSVQSQPESKVAPRTGVQSISQAVQGRVNKISPQKARQGIGSKGRQGLLSGLSSKDTIQLSGVNVNDPFNNRKIGKRLKNEFGRYFVDEDAEMINLMKRIEKETGQKDLVETWLQDSDLVRNTNSIANSKIRRNENLKLALRGLSKKQQASFDEYASARTELSNLERGLESSSKPKEQLQQIVRDGNIDFGNRFIALNNYYGDWAKDLHDAGIISKSKLDDWSQNKDYVRVQRDMEDILNYTPPTGKSRSFGTTSTSKKRTGSTREILSPTNIALERGQQLQLEIQRNKAASNTIDTLEKYGLAEKVSQQYATGKNVVKRFKDGKVEYFATSKDVKRVIENVNPFQLGVLGRVISTPTRLFRSGTTALSAPFATTNYVRDQISSAIYSDQALPRLSKTAQGNVEYIAGTHSPKNIVSGIASATKDYFGGSSNPLWEKFEQVAGDQTQFDEMRNTRSSKATMRELRQGGKGALINKIVNPVRSMEDLIGITEKATRFQNFKGIYEAEMKRSGNEKIATQKASQAALQNSVNFTRAGKAMRVINLLLPYSNAGIQGSRNVARSFRKRPVATTMKSVAFVAVPTVLLTLMNYDDEETAKVYKNIDDTEKDDNFIIVLKGAKQNEAGSYEGIIKIPKPQGYRELTNPLRIAAERFAGNEKSGDVSKMVRDAMSAFTGPVSIEDSGKFISSLIPQAVKPTLQAIENKDYYWDSQTVPDYMIDGTDDPTKRAYKSTSGTARIIADQLGVSPILVEKFIQDTAGSVGRYGINLTDRGLNKLGIVKDDQIGGKTITGDFKRRTTEARAIEKTNKTDGQRYYDNVEKATGELPKYLQDSWKSYNTSDKNFLGEVLFEKNGQAKKQAKAAAYIEHPELFEVDKKLDKLNRKKGETGNPLYDLSYNQALIVVQEKALPPGAKDEGLNALYDQQWYSQYKNKEEKYYDKIFGKGGIEENKDNPYPERSPDLISAMDSYYDLPSSYAKGAWKKANPGIASQMEAYYSAKDAWTNTERAKLGLPPIEDRYAKYESSSGKSGSSGGSRGRSRRGSSGGSSGSRKGKFDYKFGAFAPGEIGSKKSLRKILEEAQL